MKKRARARFENRNTTNSKQKKSDCSFTGTQQCEYIGSVVNKIYISGCLVCLFFSSAHTTYDILECVTVFRSIANVILVLMLCHRCIKQLKTYLYLDNSYKILLNIRQSGWIIRCKKLNEIKLRAGERKEQTHFDLQH